MQITFAAESGSTDQFVPWLKALHIAGHSAGLLSLDGHYGGPAYCGYPLGDICSFDDARAPNERERHRERACGTAAYVESCLERNKPDWLVVWGNATTAQRAAAAAAARVGVRVCYSELGWFRRQPGAARTLLFDTVGLKERRTELSLEWWDRRLSASQDAELDGYIEWWKANKSSKHNQFDAELPAEVRDAEKPVLLVLLQFDGDSAGHFAEGSTTQAAVMTEVRLATLTERGSERDWLIVVKEHPAHMRSAEPHDGEVWVRDVNLHDCLQVARCVVTANSNAGLEALLYEKPVITLADAPYGRLGFTHDCRDEGTLQRVLDGVLHMRPPSLENHFLRSFLHYIIFQYCLHLSEADKLAARLGAARTRATGGASAHA